MNVELQVKRIALKQIWDQLGVTNQTQAMAKLRQLTGERTHREWLVRKGSLWIGAHYSPVNRRWCINFVPCVTLCITLPGGKRP